MPLEGPNGPSSHTIVSPATREESTKVKSHGSEPAQTGPGDGNGLGTGGFGG